MQNNRNITDRDVGQALEFLMETGKNRMGLPSRIPEHSSIHAKGLAKELEAVIDPADSGPGSPDTLTRLKCVYRIRQSVRDHQHPTDGCSYLRFISHFFL